MASRIIRATAAAVAVTAFGATPALAYTESPAGTFNVTNTELQTAFGAGVVLSEVTFDVESNFTWYSVQCKKSLPNKKELTKTFKRQTLLSSTESVTPTATGFTIVVTGTEPRSNVRCPGGFQKDGEPVVMAQSSASHLIAEYRDMDVELVRQ